MVSEYAAAATLNLQSNAEEELVPRLAHAALGGFGYAIVISLLAIEHALRSKSQTLTRDDFAAVFARKTGFSADRNPFLADRWHEIDSGAFFPRKEVAPPPKPAQRSR
jgi:hypothetical protein